MIGRFFKPHPDPVVKGRVLSVSHETREMGRLRYSHPLYDNAWQVWLVDGMGTKFEAHGVGHGRNITTATRNARRELNSEVNRVRAGKKFNHNAHPRYGRVSTGQPGPAAI